MLNAANTIGKTTPPVLGSHGALRSIRPLDFLWFALIGLAGVHVVMLTIILYPGFVALDSGSYLEYYNTGHIDLMRMVTLQMLFAAIMRIMGGHVFGLVLFQIIVNLLSVVLSMRLMLRGARWRTVLGLSGLTILLGTRAFVYQYWVLSESLFISLSCVFTACAYRSLTQPGTRRFLLWTNVLAFAMMSVRLTGLIPVAAAALLSVLAIVRRGWLLPLVALSMLVTSLFAMNWGLKGRLDLTYQTSLQLMITANKYIDYDSEFMAAEKKLIHENHQKLLKLFSPRTRIDQMAGEYEGIRGPWLLLADYYRLDPHVLDREGHALVWEGLRKDLHWLNWLGEGLEEAMITLRSPDNLYLILPDIHDFSDPRILPYLYNVSTEELKNHRVNRWQRAYLRFIYQHLVIPRYVPLLTIIGFLAALVVYLHESGGCG